MESDISMGLSPSLMKTGFETAPSAAPPPPPPLPLGTVTLLA
jgi:hypothetical protein